MFFDVVPFSAPFMDRGKVPQCPGTATKFTMASMRRTTRQSLVRLAIKRNSRAEISGRVMAIARPIYPSMISAHTDSDFFEIGNHKVSQLFGLVV